MKNLTFFKELYRLKERHGYDMENNDYIIEMLNITKEFPGIKANDNVTLQLKRGEIHALLGESRAPMKDMALSDLVALWEQAKQK